MKFFAKRPKENIPDLARKLGYRPISRTEGEFSCVRYLAPGGYPRFHLYIKENQEKGELIFSVHLDQKKPTYAKSRAHSGEYAGETVEKEAERIKNIL